MKTAISLPDELFEAAERLARRIGRSRSELYRDALAEYLARHDADAVTEAMDAALEEVGDGRDTFVSAAADEALRRGDW